MLKKPLLFYSLYCDHSKSILSYIARKGIKSAFLLINVDRHQAQVPAFIQSVPSLFTGDSVLVDDDLSRFIDAESEKLGANSTIDAYYDKEMGSFMSDSYSYINDASGPARVERNFSLVDNDCKIITPKEDDFMIGGQRSEIDSFKTERERDIAKILSTQNADHSGRIVSC